MMSPQISSWDSLWDPTGSSPTEWRFGGRWIPAGLKGLIFDGHWLTAKPTKWRFCCKNKRVEICLSIEERADWLHIFSMKGEGGFTLKFKFIVKSYAFFICTEFYHIPFKMALFGRVIYSLWTPI